MDKGKLFSLLNNIDELSAIPENVRTEKQNKAIFKMKAAIRDSRKIRQPLPKWWVEIENNNDALRNKIMECLEMSRRQDGADPRR
ncbi:hypothetical protein [Undibacterium sp. TJN19]|uniref:hypothetical protein n=1 Tax=Undibacterium sp. TJN19 TaxID=3413055 RepID=UPI003BF265C5